MNARSSRLSEDSTVTDDPFNSVSIKSPFSNPPDQVIVILKLCDEVSSTQKVVCLVPEYWISAEFPAGKSRSDWQSRLSDKLDMGLRPVCEIWSRVRQKTCLMPMHASRWGQARSPSRSPDLSMAFDRESRRSIRAMRMNTARERSTATVHSSQRPDSQPLFTDYGHR